MFVSPAINHENCEITASPGSPDTVSSDALLISNLPGMTQQTLPVPDRANASRIRNNQRRSRAKRKEYIASLERRLAEYASEGVHATIEMQRAARAVTRENQQLRKLLERFGVSKDHVEDYLRGNDTIGLNETGQAQLRIETQTVGGIAVITPGQKNSPKNAILEPNLVRSVGEPVNCLKSGGSNNQANTCVANAEDSSATCTETPCETAASIILQMRAQDDESSVYSRLGCDNGFPRGCKINNSILFQIMDEAI
ncbi:hypothetical protein H072_10005 [Dactylellina haptotyla CBS 200.50]|uniref:BZIP domain-containing protein n=1 Tax=Dactylellina haptotyla (strain CBS 200.50) TaxID=1284197 RepID=S8A0C8_DACHA|nr:hypothetical protein H072_10005 [Dactylellina haptotyla CBS 200.50]